MTVVDKHNRVIGVITRKDLMAFNMEEKLTPVTGDKNPDELLLVLD